MRLVLVVNTATGLGVAHSGTPTEGAGDIVRAVSELGASLRPEHPGTSDPDLVRFFLVDVPRGVDVPAVIGKLRRCQGVEAVYAKPTQELP